LEALTGVTAELLKMQEYKIDWESIPIVVGAIIYDWGPRSTNAIYPDKALGRAALQNGREGIFPLGNQGAGTSATVGKLPDFSFHNKGGQGGAVGQFGPTKILVFSVVNAVGAIHDKQGNIIRGQFDPRNKSYTDLWLETSDTQGVTRNTTLTLVVTNQKFDSSWAFDQAAKQVHSAMGRVIFPFNTHRDGDVLFMVTTGDVENTQLPPEPFGYFAGELACDAVLACYE
jgi:L-aminopeptidase/D-esterase-like protein